MKVFILTTDNKCRHKFDYMPWYGSKAEIRQYLANLNKDGKVLEYCLFQPGLFVNYFAAPHKTSKHVYAFQLMWDFYGRRAIMVEGTDGGKITLITVQDFTKFVVRAVEYEGEWPVSGGVSSNVLTARQLISLGEKLRKLFQSPFVGLPSLQLRLPWPAGVAPESTVFFSHTNRHLGKFRRSFRIRRGPYRIPRKGRVKHELAAPG